MYRKLAPFSDTTAGSNSKDVIAIANPGNYYVKLLYCMVRLATSAEAGSRLLTIRVNDADGNQLFHIHASNVQAASTFNHYYIAPGFEREAFNTAGTEAGVAANANVAIPLEMLVPPGGQLLIYDQADIDGDDDVLVVRGMLAAVQ